MMRGDYRVMEHRLKERQPEPRLEVNVAVFLLERHGLEKDLGLLGRIIAPEVILRLLVAQVGVAPPDDGRHYPMREVHDPGYARRAALSADHCAERVANPRHARDAGMHVGLLRRRVLVRAIV